METVVSFWNVNMTLNVCFYLCEHTVYVSPIGALGTDEIIRALPVYVTGIFCVCGSKCVSVCEMAVRLLMIEYQQWRAGA